MIPVASYNLPSRASQRLVNVYPQPIPGKSGIELVGAPGITRHVTLIGGGRGLHVMRGKLYAVAGTSLYDVTSGVAVGLGTVPGSSVLSLADNGTQLVTDTGYYSDGSTVAQITDADLVPLEAVDFCDGYIVAVESDSGRFVGSALNDATDWDGLDFATAEGSPDELATLIVDHRQVILFGTASTEIWYNSGASGFPFERLAGGFLEIGCLAKRGVCKADNSVFWLASDRTIRRLSGSTPVRVSQHGIEEKLAELADVASCVAFSYTWQGHINVAFRFPTACFVFDVTAGEWHERESYESSTWNIVDAAELNGRVYVQHTDGSVGYLSDAVTEFGETQLYRWTYQNVAAPRRLFHSSFELLLKTGDVAANVTPYADLEISDDGGNTWHFLPRRELGVQGAYRQKVRWHALGSAYDRVYRVTMHGMRPYVSDTALQVT